MGRKIKVILQPVKFRNREHVAIVSSNSSEVDEVIREFENSEWSTGYRYWHLPLKKGTVKSLVEALKNVAVIDHSALKNYHYVDEMEEKAKRKRIKTEKPTKNQQLKLEKFRDEFLAKNYSDGTIKVYLSMLNVFFGWFNNKPDDEITMEDIQKFLTEYIDANNFTTNYMRLMTNSLRRYFTFIGKYELTKI